MGSLGPAQLAVEALDDGFVAFFLDLKQTQTNSLLHVMFHSYQRAQSFHSFSLLYLNVSLELGVSVMFSLQSLTPLSYDLSHH